MTDPAPLSPSLWNEALGAIRKNLVPGFFLWIVAACVVYLYYGVSASGPLFNEVARWKASGGYFYSVVSTGLMAGVIPFVFLQTRGRQAQGTLAFMAGFWAYRGGEIDAFYRFQGFLFGTQPTLGTIAAKVACDMLVYNVFWAAHLQLLSYRWKNGGFHLSVFRNLDWKEHFRKRLPAALISTWVVWLPVVSLTYSLPSDLQIPLFNLAALFWALVVATLTTPTEPKKSQ